MKIVQRGLVMRRKKMLSANIEITYTALNLGHIHHAADGLRFDLNAYNDNMKQIRTAGGTPVHIY
jgi:hypothetical protein